MCFLEAPITAITLPSSAAAAVLSCSPPATAVPTVSKTTPLENPPETSNAQEMGSAEGASSDQPNGVTATQAMAEQTQESVLKATPASQQEVTADEAPIASSELHNLEEATKEEKGPSVAEESTSQEVKLISAEEKACGEEPAVEKNLGEPTPSPSEDVGTKDEVGKTSDAPMSVVDGLKSLCLDEAQDKVFSGDGNVDRATQNENPDKKDPVIILSKATQSKGTAKCEAPPISSRHLSGWFIFCENKRAFPSPHFVHICGIHQVFHPVLILFDMREDLRVLYPSIFVTMNYNLFETNSSLKFCCKDHLEWLCSLYYLLAYCR